MKPRPRVSRKLLAASIGIATVSYVAGTACGTSATSGNLMPPPGNEAGQPLDASSSGGDEFVVGNLAPFPFDANGSSSGVDGTAPVDATADRQSQDSSQDAVTDSPGDAIDDTHHFVGNLAPPPTDP